MPSFGSMCCAAVHCCSHGSMLQWLLVILTNTSAHLLDLPAISAFSRDTHWFCPAPPMPMSTLAIAMYQYVGAAMLANTDTMQMMVARSRGFFLP